MLSRLYFDNKHLEFQKMLYAEENGLVAPEQYIKPKKRCNRCGGMIYFSN